MSKYRLLMPTYLEDWRQKDGGDGGYNGGGGSPPLFDHFTVYPPDANDWNLTGTSNQEGVTEYNLKANSTPNDGDMSASAGLAGYGANYTYNRRMYIEFSGSAVTAQNAIVYINIGGGQYQVRLGAWQVNSNNSGSRFTILESGDLGNTTGTVYFDDNGGADPNYISDYTVRLEYDAVGFLDYSVTGNGATYTGTLNHTDAPTRQISQLRFSAGLSPSGGQFRVDRVEADNL